MKGDVLRDVLVDQRHDLSERRDVRPAGEQQGDAPPAVLAGVQDTRYCSRLIASAGQLANGQFTPSIPK